MGYFTTTGWSIVKLNECDVIAYKNEVDFDDVKKWYMEVVNDSEIETVDRVNVHTDGLYTSFNEFGEEDKHDLYTVISSLDDSKNLHKINGSWAIFETYNEIMKKIDRKAKKKIMIIASFEI
jgi:hypothetical protein